MIYVNAAVDDGSKKAALLHYFKTADPDDMSQGPLSRRVHYLKREEGGLNEMCEYSQRIYNGGKEEGLALGRRQGISEGLQQGRREKEKEITEKVLSLKEQGFDEEMIKKVLKTITEEEMVPA